MLANWKICFCDWLVSSKLIPNSPFSVETPVSSREVNLCVSFVAREYRVTDPSISVVAGVSMEHTQVKPGSSEF